MALNVSTASGGVRGLALPFAIGEKRASATYDQLNALVGQEFEVGVGGAMVRLVRLNVAAGYTTCGSRIMAYSTGMDDTYDVQYGNVDEHPCGITDPNQADLVDDDLFWVYVLGRVTLIMGDDTNDVDIGDWVLIDNDTDLGKAKTVNDATTFAAGLSIGRAITAATDTDDTFQVEIHTKLLGSAV